MTLEESIEDAIVQRPLAAVGLALGLGFLIGGNLAPLTAGGLETAAKRVSLA